MRPLPLLILVLSAALAAAPAAARMYKWVDDQGVVQYTQHPPPDREAQTIEPRAPAVSDSQAAETLEAIREKAEAARKDRQFGEDYSSFVQEREARIQKNCEIARENLRVLQTASRVQAKDADGNPYFIDDKDRDSRIKQAEKQIEDNCK